jgi:hypothetical protein
MTGKPHLTLVSVGCCSSARVCLDRRSETQIFVDPGAFELSRWRGGRCACDTPDIMDYHNVLNRLSPFSTKSKSFKVLQAKVDSIPIA